MENFTAYSPTILHFGKDVTDKLASSVEKYGKRVLLVYGKGSIKKSGIYDKVINQLSPAGAEVFEYSGIKSNPLVEDVDKAAHLGREKNVDLVLAVGGGSVVDSAKIISITIPSDAKAWDFYSGKAKPEKAIPMINVLTLSATGSETNLIAVLQNHETEEKKGYGHPLMYPKEAFLDPQNTFSVPRNYTAYGVADLIAHALEAYFGHGDATLSDKFIFAIINEAREYGPLLLNDLHNYNYRAKIMYAAMSALSGFTMYGKVSGDWGVHSLGHILSLLYDIPHGASLTIFYPAWLKLQKDKLADKIAHLGKNVFLTNDVDATIAQLEGFFKHIECPVSLDDMNLEHVDREEIKRLMIKNKARGFAHKLTSDDYEKLVSLI
ncbi:MAG: iron-containing alcohol dehydrogenase [Bacteroidales bacterium]|nr:iron-containing alcohol dehydrogenase [Bacteroidales bacterium]